MHYFTTSTEVKRLRSRTSWTFFCTTVAKFAATSLVWPLPCIIDALREIRKTFFVKYFTGSSNNVLGNLLFKSFVETFSQNFLTFSFELFFAKEFKIARFLVRFPRRHTLKFASYHRLLSYRFMPSWGCRNHTRFFVLVRRVVKLYFS